jgi:hypothetical protein
MRRNLLLLTIYIIVACSPARLLSQDHNKSIRTNLLNLAAKGPSVTFGKSIGDRSEILLTYSLGKFSPFLTEDFYRYFTAHIEYRKKDDTYSNFIVSNLYFYYGGYLRYIHKRILSQGYDAGPYGIFAKEPRNFVGSGLAAGLTMGYEWAVNDRWLIDLNTLLGAGKYLSQVDYSGHNAINLFLDTRIALQLGYRF